MRWLNRKLQIVSGIKASQQRKDEKKKTGEKNCGIHEIQHHLRAATQDSKKKKFESKFYEKWCIKGHIFTRFFQFS